MEWTRLSISRSSLTFACVVVAAAAAAAGGRDDDDDDRINMHAKTFQSEEGEEDPLRGGTARRLPRSLAQIRKCQSRNLSQKPQSHQDKGAHSRASKPTELWHDATLGANSKDEGCIMSVCVAEYQSPSGGTLLPDCNSATAK